MIESFSAEGITIVMSTHNLGQARRLAHDVAFLHRGRLIEHGPAETFFEGPKAPEARAFPGGRSDLVRAIWRKQLTTNRRTLLLGSVTGLASGIAMLVALPLATPAQAQDFITVASTTSTENSGLFGHILPLFQEETGIEVRVVAQGTGQALETGRRGDADVVFVHARALEETFVADGFGVQRFDVMYNDFVIVGPGADPAGLEGADDAASAMAAIAEAEAPFASRGDDSGTHVAEMNLWEAAGVAPEGQWYLSTGSGMGATLNTAAQVPAYALTDRGTWLFLRQSRPARNRLRGRSGAIQSLWHHSRQSRAPSAHQGRAGTGLHRLGDLAGRAGGNRELYSCG